MAKNSKNLENLSLMDLLQLREATIITREYFYNIAESNRGMDRIPDDFDEAMQHVLKYTTLECRIEEKIKDNVDLYL